MAATAFLRGPSDRRPGHDWASPAAASDHWPQQPAPPATPASMRVAWRRWRSRRCLTALNDHMLRDIGVTRAEAEN